MAAQLGLSLGTVHKALTTLRTAILGNSLDAGQLLDGLTGRGEGGRVPVFGILEQAGWIFVDVVPDLTPESVMHFKRNFHLRTARLGGLVYTDPYRQYLALVFSGEARHRYHKHADRGLAVDAGGGFWPFARERLKRLRGVASGRFPLFIKEIEFRYNHRGADMLPVLAGYLCGFVPNLD
jgi:transposase